MKTFAEGIGRARNTAIARELIRGTVAIAQKTDFPVLVHDTSKQQQACFGTQLADAMENAWEQGYQRLIVIGNDCQGLNHKIINLAAQSLEGTQLVLGPAIDGGVYLIGMHRSAYHRDQILSIPWQTTQVQEAFASSFEHSAQPIQWLSPLDDIDTAQSFARFLRSLPKHSVVKLALKSILVFVSPICISSRLSIHALSILNIHSVRGSPAC